MSKRSRVPRATAGRDGPSGAPEARTGCKRYELLSNRRVALQRRMVYSSKGAQTRRFRRTRVGTAAYRRPANPILAMRCARRRVCKSIYSRSAVRGEACRYETIKLTGGTESGDAPGERSYGTRIITHCRRRQPRSNKIGRTRVTALLQCRAVVYYRTCTYRSPRAIGFHFLGGDI